GGRPVELASLPALGRAHGGPIVVDAADVDLDRLRHALAAAASLDYVEASAAGERLTGHLGPASAADVTALLASGAVGPALRPVKRKGSGPTIDLDFVGAPRDDLFRLLADVLRTNLVVAAPAAQTIDVRVRRLPAAQLVELAATRLGLTATRHGNLRWLRTADAPALDRKLLARKGPAKVSIDAVGARAGEVYALLTALGAGAGGAACEAGPPLTFRLHDAPLGAVLAVTAALSGQPPQAGTACAADARLDDVRDAAIHAIAAIGVRRAAAFGAPRGVVFVRPGDPLGGGRVKEIGDGFVGVDLASQAAGTAISLPLHPTELGPSWEADAPADPPADAPAIGEGPRRNLEQALAGGRLAATVLTDRGPLAIFELPEGGWFVLDRAALRDLPADAIRVEPGKVTYRLDDAAGVTPTRAGVIVLRAR
ncbi:MAG TPA: hypothetical protein VHE35_35890, partial [Kofleriaceae bacterium]|nr:hypothetical protein [Kofleriaceae bacterium]